MSVKLQEGLAVGSYIWIHLLQISFSLVNSSIEGDSAWLLSDSPEQCV